MPARRVSVHRLQELVRLHRLGKGAREIARLLKMSPKTEYAYRSAIDEAGLLRGEPADLPAPDLLRRAVERARPPAPAPQNVSSVERWRPEVEEMCSRGVPPKAIHDFLRLNDPEFPKGKYQAVKRLCARIKKERGVQAEDVVIPVVTEPGQLAQVDFGYVGRLFDPETRSMRKAWVFVMVLCHSRHMWADVVFDQRVETWLSLHARAFAALGGVPHIIRPDQLKAAVIRTAFAVHGATSLNRSYVELARHYGFLVDPAPPRQPQKKGKVESAVKYVKGNFFKAHRPPGDQPWSIQDARAELERWVREIAGERDHGTTHRRPLEVFETEEQSALKPLPLTLWEPITWKKAKVHRDFHIEFARRLYSVPWRLVGEEVWVRATPTSVHVYFEEERVATHSRSGSECRITADHHAPPDRGPWRQRSREYWEERAGRLGAEVEKYVRAVFDSTDVLYNIRTVQAIVTCLEKYPDDRARAAAERAHYFANYTYRGLKNILAKGLDLQPIPDDEIEWQATLPTPRFARSASEFIPSSPPPNGDGRDHDR